MSKTKINYSAAGTTKIGKICRARKNKQKPVLLIENQSPKNYKVIGIQ